MVYLGYNEVHVIVPCVRRVVDGLIGCVPANTHGRVSHAYPIANNRAHGRALAHPALADTTPALATASHTYPHTDPTTTHPNRFADPGRGQHRSDWLLLRQSPHY